MHGETHCLLVFDYNGDLDPELSILNCDYDQLLCDNPLQNWTPTL